MKLKPTAAIPVNVAPVMVVLSITFAAVVAPSKADLTMTLPVALATLPIFFF